VAEAWQGGGQVGSTADHVAGQRPAGALDLRYWSGVRYARHGDRAAIRHTLTRQRRQAREIATWGQNVYVKIPVTNTMGEFAGPLIETLSRDGINLNVTAIFTLEQTRKVAAALAVGTPAVVSVFAGRIADTGRDPVPHMRECLALLKERPKAELLWASPRELINIFQANEIGCHIITVPGDIIKKLPLIGKDMDVYSKETVAMFYRDATSAGFSIPLARG